MSDLSKISTEELLRDRQESINDAFFCHLAMHDDEPAIDEAIEARLEKNVELVNVISIELRNRGIDWL